MKKQVFIPIVIILAVLLLAGCAPSAAPSAPASQTASAPASQEAAAASGQLTLTKEQLSTYNGQNGQPAYVAVDGVIYDVTNIPQWQGGQHNGHVAGTDISAEFKTLSASQTQRMLQGVPIVGKLSD